MRLILRPTRAALPPVKRSFPLLLFKGALGDRLAARQGPQDRAAWQANYVAQSRSGTDIHRPGATVGDSGIADDAMNKMSPAARLAHLQRISGLHPDAPPHPHYQVDQAGRVQWGHAMAGMRPLAVGDRLLAHRGSDPTRPPVKLRVASHRQTAIGRAMTLTHPDGNTEEMHGTPPHEMYLHPPATGTAGARPRGTAPLVLQKSTPEGKRARRKLKPRALHVAGSREGRDKHGRDFWYHLTWLRDNEPEIAKNCEASDAAGDAGDGGGDIAKSLPPMPGQPRHVQNPGSRGGHYWYDQRGTIRYGDRPVGHLHQSELPPDAPPHPAPPSAEVPADPSGLRARMKATPLPGDRFLHEGVAHEVRGTDAEGGGPVYADTPEGPVAIHPDDWREGLRDHFTPLKPNQDHPRRERALRAASERAERDSPQAAVAGALARRMQGDNAPGPQDTTGDPPHVAALRAQFATGPKVEDVFAVAQPIAVTTGAAFEPGGGYSVAYVDGGIADVYDTFGNPTGSLDAADWHELTGHRDFVPMKRGEGSQDDDPTVPADGVEGVFQGKVTRAEAKAAWSGDNYGGYSTRIYNIKEEPGKFIVYGEISDPTGDPIGDFERRVERRGNGQIEVTHHLLDLRDGRGTGFADAFNRQAEEFYGRWGVDRVYLSANISVGKYAWAMQGYDFANDIERESVVGRFVEFCEARGHTIPIARVMQLQHSWDIAKYAEGPELGVRCYQDPHRPGRHIVDGTFPTGKAFLLADPEEQQWADACGTWAGVKRLSDKDDPTMRQTRRYRKERDQR